MQPLAERMRPKKLDEYLGQRKLMGKDGMLKAVLSKEFIPSLILWGPPGVGKTTLAELIARESGRDFFQMSAVNAGVKDMRAAIQSAEDSKQLFNKQPVLFIDEIHRFSKSQQDALLQAVENGTIILIGATTENPSFEVINALLSRCQVYILEQLDEATLKQILENAIKKDEFLSKKNILLKDTSALISFANGDARKALNILELMVNSSKGEQVVIDNELTGKILDTKINYYSKKGEEHYDIISAFIKSIRGSDPNAAVFWLARMIDAGEDEKFIARRMIISAAEDIGLANPNALLMANTCMDTVQKIGFPEARIIMSQTAAYLALSPKSNSTYLAINEALSLIKKGGDFSVPMHLRNAPTKLMKEAGYGKEYLYAHDYENNFVEQNFLPENIKGTIFYKPGENNHESKFLDWLKKNWGRIYKY